jgi:cell division protease FtsH
MAKALLEMETIDADQIDDIMAGRPPRPPRPTHSTSGSSSGGSAPSPDAAPSANPA